MTELLKDRDYELLSECHCFDKGNILLTTPIKKVKMYALKFCDSDGLNDLSDYKTIQFLCEKGYISPLQEGCKLKFDSMDVRTAKCLIVEYSKSFLDLTPFLPKE